MLSIFTIVSVRSDRGDFYTGWPRQRQWIPIVTLELYTFQSLAVDLVETETPEAFRYIQSQSL